MGAVTGARPAPTGPDRWAVRWRPAPQAGVRLFCLPQAGGGASTFRTWAHRLAPAVEVVAVQLPGRESRFGERPYTDLGHLLPELIRNLTPLIDRPHAWFGHSMGAPIGFEICRALRRLGLPEPLRLFVGGHPAPHLTPREEPFADAPDDAFIARIRDFSDAPAEVLANTAMLTALLPMLRADCALAETYRYRHEPPLGCPVSVFGGTDDALVDEDELAAWKVHTSAECTVRLVAGGHSFLHRNPGPVLEAITADLTTAPADPDGSRS